MSFKELLVWFFLGLAGIAISAVALNQPAKKQAVETLVIQEPFVIPTPPAMPTKKAVVNNSPKYECQIIDDVFYYDSREACLYWQQHWNNQLVLNRQANQSQPIKITQPNINTTIQTATLESVVGSIPNNTSDINQTTNDIMRDLYNDLNPPPIEEEEVCRNAQGHIIECD